MSWWFKWFVPKWLKEYLGEENNNTDTQSQEYNLIERPSINDKGLSLYENEKKAVIADLSSFLESLDTPLWSMTDDYSLTESSESVEEQEQSRNTKKQDNTDDKVQTYKDILCNNIDNNSENPDISHNKYTNNEC